MSKNPGCLFLLLFNAEVVDVFGRNGTGVVPACESMFENPPPFPAKLPLLM
jgi:hypothetical protein